MKNLLVAAFILFSLVLQAQKAPLEWKILDESNESLPGVAMLIYNDEGKLIENAVSDINGFIKVDLPLQRLSLQMQLLGYQDTALIVSPEAGAWPKKSIQLKVASEILNEVAINAMAESQTISGDTTIMNAEAFKVTEDASTGDLLQKMPGVEISNGSVQAQGEEVTKVFVDGKPFFGEDSKAALDLIPAEMVQGIKIYDRLSDQARFTGFKDGNTDKTIDIITKKSKRFGVFGQVNGGYGTDETYQLNTQLNLFRDKERISLILTSDNVNGTGNGLGQFVRRRGRNIAISNVPSGIAESWTGGLNYNNSYKNGLDLQASYSFNSSDRSESTRIARSYILPSDSGQIFREESTSRSETFSHNVNLDMTWQIDSNNAIEFDPSFNFSRTKSFSNTISRTLQGGNELNSNLRQSNFLSDSWELNGELLYKYSFPKKGRTLSSYAEYENSHSDATESLDAISSFTSSQRLSDTLQQSGIEQNSSPVLSGGVTYTEPIGENGLLELRYNLERDQQDNNLKTYDLLASDADLILDTTLSNVFLSNIYTHEYNVGYQWEGESAWSFSTRLGGQNILLDNQQELPSVFDDQRRFQAVLPFASVSYEPEEKDLRIRLRYRTNTDVPGISQLQTVIINRNPILLTTGNENLQMSYTHDVSLRLIANDPRNSNGFFAYASMSSTDNYIGSSTQIASEAQPISGLEPGQQLIKPVNLDGYMQARAFSYYGFPLYKGKLKGSLRAGLSYVETPSLINLEENIAKTLNPSISAGIASNISEFIDFNLNGGLEFGQIRNTLNDQADNDYRNWNAQISAKYRPEWGLTLETDLTYIANVGLSAGFDQAYTVWNAGIGYKLLKSKKLEAKLWVFDILGQNTSISRSFTSTYTEDRQELVLSRYLMFSLTYRFGEFKSDRRGGGRGRPPGR